MCSKASRRVEFAPFPPLSVKGIECRLKGRETFKTWAGFYSNRKGSVEVEVFPPEEVEDDLDAAAKVPPLPAQVEAYRYLKVNETEVTAAVLRAVFKEFPKLRRLIGADKDDYPHDEFPMPAVASAEQLKRLFGPIRFCVLAYAKEGVAYVGMEMDCTWDPEHRLGVMTHKSRVLEVGEGDLSFDREASRRDGGLPLRQL